MTENGAGGLTNLPSMVVACSVHLEPCRKHSSLLPFAVTSSEIKENVEGYLLIEESPEHGQRNVEEQNLEDHLDLRDQKFLGEKKRREGGYRLPGVLVHER